MTQAEHPRVPRSSPEVAHDAPTALGRAARRLSGWAGNLLATAIVLAAGLGFGRQVLVWWSGEPARVDPRPVVAPTLGDELHSHLLQFGEVPQVLEREVLVGDRSLVFATLLARCRAAAEAGGRFEHPAGPAELNLLSQAKRLQAVETAADGHWQVFEIDGPLPLVAAIAQSPAPNGTGVRRRVVSWGLALPENGQSANHGTWTLFTCSSASAAVRSPGTDRRPAGAPNSLPPLPEGATRTLLLAARDGAALVGFRGGGTPRDVIDFYDGYFAAPARGGAWQRTAPWQELAGGWHARYERAGAEAVDLQLVTNNGNLSGMLTVTPPRVP